MNAPAAERQSEPPFPTVGIGASAGGLRVLQTLFDHIAPDLGAAYVVIVHLDPEHQSELAEILGARTKMPVTQVTGKMEMAPNNVYVIPPNRRLLISDREIATFVFDEPRGQRAPIDQFFRSLADQHGDGFALILSGAGSDGAMGVKAIKEGGGIIIVQDPADAEYPSMPRHAIATGFADFVLPAAEIGARLGELIRAKAHIPQPDFQPSEEECFRRVLALLRARTGHDFALYKRSTVYRRLARRMQLARVESLEDYHALLRRDVKEVQNLFADLLISVTTFFRDAAAFDHLAAHIVPKLFDANEIDTPIRVWVCGCASGEEAYSIGMLLLEEASRREDKPAIQIFASDLDAGALVIAREGRYPAAVAVDVGEERLRRFFTKEGEHYRVKRDLRDLILFAGHSILKDPPFSRLDLISCRNLLIYLDRELQQQVCQTFHYALKPDGYLFLGSSETADHPPGLFRAVDREARLYQSTRRPGEHATHIPRLSTLPRLFDTQAPSTQPPAPRANRLQAHSQALEQLGPPSILIDRAHRILHMSESAGRFLQPSAGPMSNDVTELARTELRFDLRACLHLAFEKGRSDLSLPIPVQFNGCPVRVYLLIRPLPNKDGGATEQAVIYFIEGGPIAETPTINESVEDHRGAEEHDPALREELELTRSHLRTSREEFEAANEELRAANEELQSINEEYRSTSEELETSKEELQSINEELQTVNSELKVKLDTGARVNADLQNLISATNIATLFLDTNLRIRRFTPPVAALFNIAPSDEDRPITDFTNRLDYKAFAEDARQVLADLIPIEREISGGDRWFLTRLRPYRTLDDRIDGVVVSFIDVTERRKIAEELRAAGVRQELLAQELSHRVKNTLAVVQSMARLSFRDGGVTQDALNNFSGRLAALSQAHDLLIDGQWKGAELRRLVALQLGPHASGERIKIEGPPVSLRPAVATSFSLILHELATNAMKHGALADGSGTLALSWSLEPGDDGLLNFTWSEHGTKGLSHPTRKGFGSLLLERGLPDGDIRRTFSADGMTCLIKTRIAPAATANGAYSPAS